MTQRGQGSVHLIELPQADGKVAAGARVTVVSTPRRDRGERAAKLLIPHLEAIQRGQERVAEAIESSTRATRAATELTTRQLAPAPARSLPFNRVQPSEVPRTALGTLMEALRGAIRDASLVQILMNRIEAGTVRIHWVRDPSPSRKSDGWTELRADNSIDMVLNLASVNLRRTCHHEAQHLADFLVHERKLTVSQMEERAVEHTRLMLAPATQPKPLPEPELTRVVSSGNRRRWY